MPVTYGRIITMKLLLHVCCAPCSAACIAALREEGIEPVLFWYNPNIHPFREYINRRDTLFGYAKDLGLDLIAEDEYGLRPFIGGLAVEAEKRRQTFEEAVEFGKRCVYCYRLRLEKTASLAKEKGFDAFSTTLLVSPYQNHELIVEEAEKAASIQNVSFVYRDFRPRFREGQAEARKRGLYMQRHCGCIFSEEDAERQRAAKLI
jgi:predicted adenine nucleotide alpha hydrolase (AANH) superfamily ATPase